MLRVDTILTGLAGSPYFSRLYFEGATEEDANTVRDAVASMWTSLFTGVNPFVGRLTATVQGEVASMNPGSGDIQTVYVDDDIVVSPGSTTIAIVPNASQVLVRLQTGTFRGGRRVLGKMFIPCTRASGQDSDGNVTSTMQAGVKAAVDLLIPVGLGVWSRPSERFALGTLTPVTSTGVWSEYAVMRSRRD